MKWTPELARKQLEEDIAKAHVRFQKRLAKLQNAEAFTTRRSELSAKKQKVLEARVAAKLETKGLSVRAENCLRNYIGSCRPTPLVKSEIRELDLLNLMRREPNFGPVTYLEITKWLES